jgi:DNA-binding protein YbaB
MTPDFDPTGVEALLARTRALLDSARAAAPAAAAGPTTAETADGLVRVVATGGTVDRIELDPKAMRLASDELAAALTQAVNAALAAADPAAAAGPAVDLAALSGQVRQVQEDGVRQLAAINEGIAAAMARLGQRG